jgi:hypothetical protein
MWSLSCVKWVRRPYRQRDFRRFSKQFKDPIRSRISSGSQAGASMVCWQRATKVRSPGILKDVSADCCCCCFSEFAGNYGNGMEWVRLTPDADYMNFDNILWALLVVFQCMTMEGPGPGLQRFHSLTLRVFFWNAQDGDLKKIAHWFMTRLGAANQHYQNQTTGFGRPPGFPLHCFARLDRYHVQSAG